MRALKSLLITPSVDLSHVAEQHQKDMPYLIQYFLSSLGRDAASCADLMSYLLFTSKYTSALVEIGYDDANKRIDEIESFLYSPDDGNDYSVAQRTAKVSEGSSIASERSTGKVVGSVFRGQEAVATPPALRDGTAMPRGRQNKSLTPGLQPPSDLVERG